MKLVLFALVALAPIAGAAIPATCADPCMVSSSALAFVLPATTIASGTSVSWISIDGGHVIADGVTPASSGSCLQHLGYNAVDPTTPATLTIVDGALVSTVDGRDATCTSATALPTGDIALPYFCTLHANMRGVLVVSP
ncbi:MAG TPA: hypothetical protein VM370_11605 [Candidatus Thermoplasmatota archaeon]|nr:hypothetical protein [Candidatus Thermoplasmatota archaeon]